MRWGLAGSVLSISTTREGNMLDNPALPDSQLHNPGQTLISTMVSCNPVIVHCIIASCCHC